MGMDNNMMSMRREMMAPMMRVIAYEPEHLLARKDSLQLTNDQVTKLTTIQTASKSTHDAAANDVLVATLVHLHRSFPRDLTRIVLGESATLLAENVREHEEVVRRSADRDGAAAVEGQDLSLADALGDDEIDGGHCGAESPTPDWRTSRVSPT